MLKSIIIDSLYQPIPGFHIDENKKMIIYPDVGLLNHMVILFLFFFRNLHIVCHSCWTLIDIPPAMYKGSNFSTALPMLFIFWLFNNRHSNRFNTINTHRNQLKKKNTLNTRPETVNLLEENTGRKFLDTGLGNNFLVISPKVQATKAKIDKWDYIILKNSA